MFINGDLKMNSNEILSELETIVGQQFVSDQPEETYLYHYDFITAEPEGKCDIVIIIPAIVSWRDYRHIRWLAHSKVPC